ncbi:MAG: hypothetical protein JEZ03_03140 [Bacteroidales bacterium]|nr:hypothetical protein [Bacteroidales bacterium]
MKQITLLLLLSTLLFSCGKQKTEVLLCSTIHGAHKINPNYSYEDLYSFIESYHPDVIGVEIRYEDMDSSVRYLGSIYPSEMYECISKYADKEVLGFDWLGDNLKGMGIPKNYWKEQSVVKRAERELDADSIMMKKLSELDPIIEKKTEIVLNSSLYELNNGTYDSLNSSFYERLTAMFQDTKYSIISDFYRQRDEHIAQNIIDIIERNPGKKLIFLMGGDHRSFALAKLKQKFGDQILLKSISKE